MALHDPRRRSLGRRQSQAAALKPLCGALALVAGLLWAGAPGLAEAPKTPSVRPTVEQLVRYFDTTVFGAADVKSMALHVITKWQTPIRIAVQGHASAKHREFLENHAKTLSGLTGLSIEVLPPGASDQNITVVFVSRPGMSKVRIPGIEQSVIDRLAAPGGCYFIAFRHKKSDSLFVEAVIVVNTQRKEEHINHCLLEELSQSLGLPNDSDTLRPSLFSDLDYLLAPSRADTILIKTLYDPRMKPGLPRHEALEVARTIIAELDRTLP